MSWPWWLYAVIVNPAAAVAVLVSSYVVLADRLPDHLAVHFGLSGEPNGYLSAIATLVLVLVPWIVLPVFGLIRRGRRTGVLFTAYTGGSVALFAWALILWSNLDVPAAVQARPVSIALVLVGVLGAFSLGQFVAAGWARRVWPGSEISSRYSRIVRCSDGHLFLSKWRPGLSLKAVRLGSNVRYQYCPAGRHWKIVTPVNEASLTEEQRAQAGAHPDVPVP